MTLAPNHVETLIAAAKAGSREALGELLQQFRSFLKDRARHHLDPNLKVKAEESDLVQESLLAALQGFPEFKGFSEDEITAWLVRILAHRAINLHKHFRGTVKRDIGRERPLSTAAVMRAPQREQEDGARDEIVGQGEKRAALMRRTLRKLPGDYQLVVKLYYREKKSFEEVAVCMDRSVDAVRKLWGRALRCWRNAVKLLEKDR